MLGHHTPLLHGNRGADGFLKPLRSSLKPRLGLQRSQAPLFENNTGDNSTRSRTYNPSREKGNILPSPSFRYFLKPLLFSPPRRASFYPLPLFEERVFPLRFSCSHIRIRREWE